MRKRSVFLVAPNTDGRWDVKRKGINKPVSTHRKKTNAVQKGKRLAKAAPLGQIRIKGRNGRIQAEHNYG